MSTPIQRALQRLPRGALGAGRNLLVLAFSILLGLAAAEGILRAFFSPHLVTPYTLHPRYLHTLRPGVTKRFRHLPVNGGRVVTFRINENGFRGEPLQPRAGQTRVVVYGDSFIEAGFTELESTFTEQLERRLAAGAPSDVEVINAGVTAYGPDQICRRLEDEMVGVDPDLVIVSLFADNDMGDLLRNKIFRLGDGGGLEDNPFVISNTLRETWRQAEHGWFVAKLVRKVLDGLGPQRVIAEEGATRRMETWLVDARLDYEAYVVQGNNKVINLLADFYDADVSLTPASESAAYKLALAEAVLGRIRTVLAQAGRPLLLLLIPSPVDVCETYDYGRADRVKYPDYDPRALTGALSRMAARLQVPAVDLFEAFQEAGACSLYLRGGDNHWNEDGQALAAEEVAAFIRSRSLLPGQEHPATVSPSPVSAASGLP